jgi:hypothetical protein
VSKRKISSDLARLPVCLEIEAYSFSAGWSWGCVSAIDSNGRTIWIADAHRDDEKRFLEKERERHCDHARTAHAPMKLTIAGKGKEEQ